MKKCFAALLCSLFLLSCGTSQDDEVIQLEAHERTTYEPDTTVAQETNAPSASVTETEVPAPAREQWDIVSLSPTATEMLFAIGLGDWVVAVDNYSNWPPEAPMIAELSAFNPNIEMIADLEPDLVVVSDWGIDEELKALGLNVFVAPAAESLDDVFNQIDQLAVLTGAFDGAETLIDSMKMRIASVVASIDRPAEPLTYYHELDDTLYSVTSSTFIGQIYSMAGLINVADAADEDGSSWGYPQLSQEFLLEADPDIIFYADAKCCGQSAEIIAARPGWSELTAVKNGNIYEIDADISSRWGPRLPDFLEAVSAAVAALNE